VGGMGTGGAKHEGRQVRVVGPVEPPEAVVSPAGAGEGRKCGIGQTFDQLGGAVEAKDVPGRGEGADPVRPFFEVAFEGGTHARSDEAGNRRGHDAPTPVREGRISGSGRGMRRTCDAGGR